MKRIYFDNAATSWPKPEKVNTAVFDYMNNSGFSAGRSVHSGAMDSNRMVYSCREALANFFDYEDASDVVFTNNITMSLNMLIKGVIKDGWHVITTSMEHNSVLRPLFAHREACDFELEILPCTQSGLLDIELLKNSIKSNTKLIVISHASNVTGIIQPIVEIGAICKQNGIYFIIDCAQSAGTLSVSMKNINCNALAFTGHKGLLAPQGVGGFIIDKILNEACTTIIQGGTGSSSYELFQPHFMPDKFESGTMNGPAIAGLKSALQFLDDVGIHNIRNHEACLLKVFKDGAHNIKNLILYSDNKMQSVAVASFNIIGLEPAEVGHILDLKYNIMCRTGVHCAALAHKTIGTYPAGTVRFSFGYFNTIEEVKFALKALQEISDF